jgi:hypothetical protein
MSVVENLGVEELDEFSPSPGLFTNIGTTFTDLGTFAKAVLAALGNFLG